MQIYLYTRFFTRFKEKKFYTNHGCIFIRAAKGRKIRTTAFSSHPPTKASSSPMTELLYVTLDPLITLSILASKAPIQSMPPNFSRAAKRIAPSHKGVNRDRSCASGKQERNRAIKLTPMDGWIRPLACRQAKKSKFYITDGLDGRETRVRLRTQR